MPGYLIGSVVGLALLAPGAVAAEPVAQALQKHGWLTDYEQARAAARRSGKPLLVVFRCQP